MVPNGVDDAMKHLKLAINQLRSRLSSCWDRRTSEEETDEVTETSRLLPNTAAAGDDSANQFITSRWSWQFGVALATFSGFCFTANNFLIQAGEPILRNLIDNKLIK